MKIIAMQSENIKRLTAVYIEPRGPLVEITGKNGQGKSSVLDSILYALAGDRVIAKDPIRHGAERARIVLDCGEIIVTRTFRAVDNGKPYVTSLTIERADGSRIAKPQAMLDELLGEIAFDPLVFERAKPDERFDMIRRLLPDIDFEAVEKANQIDADQRTEIGRKAKELHARAGAVVADMGVGDEIKDIAAIEDQLAAAAEHNSLIEQRKNRRWQAESDSKRFQDQAREARARAERLRKEADALDDEAIKLVAKSDELEERLGMAEPLPEPIDIAATRAALDAAKTHNIKVAARKDRLELQRLAKAADDEYESLTIRIDKRKRELRDKVAASTFPIAGVTFEDRAVFLGGVPFEQASQAERLRCAVEIAMALNPKLRVVRVQDGSRLDDDSMAMLAQMASERDCQVWIETIHSDGRDAIVINDGAIEGQDSEAIENKKRKAK